MQMAEFRDYGKDFVSSTLCSMLKVWIQKGFIQTPEQLTQIAMCFFEGFHHKESN